MKRLVAPLLLVFVPLVHAASRAWSADSPLLYGPTAGEEFAYEIKISVKHQGNETRFEGVTRYHIDAVSDEHLVVTYRGGLAEKSPAPDRSSPFRPAPPNLPGILGRPTFTGTTQQSHAVTFSRRGDVLAMNGTSQLPFLLGNVSQLPFEILPPADSAESPLQPGLSWTADSAVTITETKRPSFGSPIFRPSPGDNAMRAGQEETRYELLSISGDLAKIKKITHLVSPVIEGQTSYETQGEGVWEFDTQSRMPHAGDFELTVKFASENVLITLPISVKFQRLDAEELARRQAESKRMAEETAAKLAEQRRESEKPLSAAEKQELLAMLRSNHSVDLVNALNRLSNRRPQDPDAEVQRAIRAKLDHPNRAVQMSAHRALASWSPEFERWSKINKAYEDGRPVDSSGRAVDQNTPLVVGQLVQVRSDFRDRWAPAEVIGLMADSTVAVKLRGNRGRLSESRRASVYDRKDIELAPVEVDQPGAPGVGNPTSTVKAAGQSHAATRLWSDASGKFRVEATFLALEGDQVKLRKTDGREIAVPLERLSSEDREVASSLAGSSRATTPVNPFE